MASERWASELFDTATKMDFAPMVRLLMPTASAVVGAKTGTPRTTAGLIGRSRGGSGPDGPSMLA